MKTLAFFRTGINSLLAGSLIGLALPGFGSDITALDGLGFQAASDLVDSQPMQSGWSSDLFIDRQYHIELYPDQDAVIHGNLTRFGLNLRHSLRKGTDLALGLRGQAESLDSSDLGPAYWKTKSKNGGNFSLALRQSILNQESVHLAIIPYIEPGLSSSDGFSLVSKTRLGVIVSSGLSYKYWDLTGNFGYRYRPIEYYGPYRLAGDYHMSGRLGLKLNPFSLHGEIHERNLFILATQKRRPNYERYVSQYHKLIAAVTYEEYQFSLFWGRAIQDKTFGMPGNQLGLAFSWDIGRQRPKSDLPPSTTPQETLPESKPEQLDAPIDLIQPDDSDAEYPLERLDEIENLLMKMQLVEESSGIRSLQEQEQYELQLGEAMIRQLRQVDQVMDEKRQLDEIRKKMQAKEQARRSGVQDKETDSSPALLDLLDKRAQEDKPLKLQEDSEDFD